MLLKTDTRTSNLEKLVLFCRQMVGTTNIFVTAQKLLSLCSFFFLQVAINSVEYRCKMSICKLHVWLIGMDIENPFHGKDGSLFR